MIKVTNEEEFEKLEAQLDDLILESVESPNNELIYIIKDDADFKHTAELMQCVSDYRDVGDTETAVLLKNKNGQHRFSIGG